jgi:drug/metabolite transporter (DMT)-like permease
MNLNALTSCLLAGCFFGSRQLVMKGAAPHPLIAAVLLHIGSLATFAVAILFVPTYRDALHTAPSFWSKVMLFALTAGALNGLGHLNYAKVMVSQVINNADATVIMFAALLTITTIGGKLFFGEAFTLNRLLGFISAGVTIWFLTRDGGGS